MRKHTQSQVMGSNISLYSACLFSLFFVSNSNFLNEHSLIELATGARMSCSKHFAKKRYPRATEIHFSFSSLGTSQSTTHSNNSLEHSCKGSRAELLPRVSIEECKCISSIDLVFYTGSNLCHEWHGNFSTHLIFSLSSLPSALNLSSRSYGRAS